MADFLSVSLQPNATGANLGRAILKSRKESKKLITRILVRGLGNIQEITPVGASGRLRGGYMIEGPHTIVQGRTRGAIVNGILYHDIRELGRRPGRMPPPRALERWVGSKLGVALENRPAVAFLVARKIGARGYEGAHMVKRGWAKTRRQIKPELRKLGIRVVREVSRPS